MLLNQTLKSAILKNQKQNNKKQELNFISSNPSKRWWWRWSDSEYIWKVKTTGFADGLGLEVKETEVKDHKGFRPEELER